MTPTKLLNKKAPKIKEINFLENNYTIVYFYPRDNTPGCTLEANDFTSLLPQFKKLKTQIYGISKDSEKSHCNFIKKHNLKIDLIPDEKHKIQEKYKVWQLKKFMGREFMGTVRTTFIINNQGKIIKIWEKVKARAHAKEVLEYINNL